MENGLDINIERFVATIDVTKNPEFVHYLKDALIWLGKRQNYSHEYYRQLKRNTSSKKLEAALFLDDQTIRVKFEAAILAYLQNIHAACDAFPFALHVLLGGLSTAKKRYENEHFKWNRALFDEVERKFPGAITLHSALRSFSADVTFLMLASLVNQAKHKFFPRVHCALDVPANRYSIKLLSFEYFTYPDGKPVTNTMENLDILEFAKLVHDDTLHKLFGLYKLAYECVGE